MHSRLFVLHRTLSLRSKRFRGVREQRKSEKRDFRCFARAKISPLQPPSPLSFFGSRPIFRAGKAPKLPFLGLSLLPNPTETLATQAIEHWNRDLLLSVANVFFSN